MNNRIASGLVIRTSANKSGNAMQDFLSGQKDYILQQGSEDELINSASSAGDFEARLSSSQPVDINMIDLDEIAGGDLAELETHKVESSTAALMLPSDTEMCKIMAEASAFGE